MKLLITGGCGFLGSNLAAEALRRGDELTVFDNLFRFGSEKNLAWLRGQGTFRYIHGDIRNREDVDQAVRLTKPDAIFHLAGQVAMTTSIANPRMDFEVNALGSLNLLEAVRVFTPDTPIIYSSTNKTYGDLEQFSYEEEETRYTCIEYPRGFPEDIALEFHSPYGCSKGAADQYMLDYARIFGLKTVVFRHSSMYGGRQFSTADQGWVGWFCQKALEIRSRNDRTPFTIHGNGKQVRDLLYANDMISLYFKTLDNVEKAKGEVFNIGGGIKNSFSLLELFSFLGDELDIQMIYKSLPFRESDQRIFVADLEKVQRFIGWEPMVDKKNGTRKMLNWLEESSAI